LISFEISPTIQLNGDFTGIQKIGDSQMTTETEKDFKSEYTKATAANLHNEEARKLSDKVLSTLTSLTVSPAIADVRSQMAEALANSDDDLVFQLSSKLKDIKDNQKKHSKDITDLRSKFTFADVLNAFKPEFDAVSYELAYTVLTNTHVAIANSGSKGKRGPNKPKDDSGEPKEKAEMAVYTITKGDKSAELPLRRGRVTLSIDKEAFDLLGFKIVLEDGKEVLEPGVITLNDGKTNIPAGRSAIVKAIEEQSSPMFKGFTATKK